MATNPDEIHLSLEHKRLIAERADQNGKPWQDVLQEALEPKSVEDSYEFEDTEFLALCAEDLKELEERLGPPPSLEEVRHILSKVPGNMSDDIIEDRGDR